MQMSGPTGPRDTRPMANDDQRPMILSGYLSLPWFLNNRNINLTTTRVIGYAKRNH